MRLTGKWRIVVEGDADHFRVTHPYQKGVDYLLGRLVTGQEVASEALAEYGLSVRVLADEDEIISVPPPGE